MRSDSKDASTRGVWTVVSAAWMVGAVRQFQVGTHSSLEERFRAAVDR